VENNFISIPAHHPYKEGNLEGCYALNEGLLKEWFIFPPSRPTEVRTSINTFFWGGGESFRSVAYEGGRAGSKTPEIGHTGGEVNKN
jgi:hypothetical protein